MILISKLLNSLKSPDRRSQQLSRFMLLVFLLVFTVFLVAWASEKLSPRTAPYTIYYVGKTNNLSIEFWRTIDEGLNAAAKEFNVKLTKLNASDEWRIDENLQKFEEAVAAKPDAIILSASDFEQLAQPVADAVRKGQKIIMLDSDVKRIQGSEPLALIATDNHVAGQKVATYVSEHYPKEASVVIVVQQMGVATADQRRSGVLDVLIEKGFTNIATIDAHGSKDIARESLLKELDQEKVDIVIAVNEYTTEASAMALKERGLDGKLALVGIDSSRQLVPYIEDGTIKASVVQQPYNIAYLSVKAAVDALEHRPLPALIDVDSKLITKEGLYLPENQKLLFPFQITEK